MEAFKTLILIVNIFSSLAIIGLVLMQHGRGADAGASFGGSGSAQGVFGSGGNANFLSRMTGVAATVFFATCLLLGYIHSQRGSSSGLDFSNIQQSQSAPAIESTSAPVPMQDSLSVPSAASAASSAGEAAKPEAKESSFSAGEAALAGAAGAAAAKIAADKVADNKDKKAAASQSKSKKSDKDKKSKK
ncbi:preprotein translocase subunit SecG [Conchiformibius steedae]|nr:preprotein translocase subunit SecG [Conchiformibius steedae]